MELIDSDKIYSLEKTLSLSAVGGRVAGISCHAQLRQNRPKAALEEETVLRP